MTQAPATLDDRVRSLTSLVRRDASITRLVGLLVILILVFGAIEPSTFLSVLNFQTIAFSVPEIGLLSLAVMAAMMTGGIDLSIASTASLSALATMALFQHFDAADATGGSGLLYTVLFIAAGLVVGVLCGLLNGFLVSVVGITPILATLGTWQLYNGIGIATTGGEAIYGAPDVFQSIGNGSVAMVPYAFVIFVAVGAVLWVIARRSALGTKMLLVGANPVASSFSGINNRRVLMSTYVLAGLLSGIAGVIIASRTASASADYGQSYLLLAIVVAVLGGTDPYGGKGAVVGVILAAITLQVLSSGFNIIGRSSDEYTIAQGVILIAVMAIDVSSARRRRRRRPSTPEPEKKHEEAHQ